MLKNIVKLEHIIEEKVGHFLCDNDTPIPAAKEMLLQFLKYIGQIEDNIKAQQEAAKAEKEAATLDEKIEEIKTEEPKEV